MLEDTLSVQNTELLEYLSKTSSSQKKTSPNKPFVDIKALKKILDDKVKNFRNPNTERFHKAFKALPDISCKQFSVNKGTITIESEKTSSIQTNQLKKSLEILKPWRKGPFKINKVKIDSEWKSELKWERLRIKECNLKNKRVLDIGCGNGYYLFRMVMEEPALIVGIDPSDLNYFQFYTIKKYWDNCHDKIHKKTTTKESTNLMYAPIGLKDCQVFKKYFDRVFCMGVMYHQRSPIEALTIIKETLRPKGKLLLETLTIDSEDEIALYPRGRYAGMRNIQFIPSLNCLKNWCNRAGFKKIELINQEVTTIKEQRVTEWSQPVSLEHSLHPDNPLLTKEGYERPKRTIINCNL